MKVLNIGSCNLDYFYALNHIDTEARFIRMRKNTSISRRSKQRRLTPLQRAIPLWDILSQVFTRARI